MVKEIKKNRKYVFFFKEEHDKKVVLNILKGHVYKSLGRVFTVKEALKLNDLSNRTCFLIKTENKKDIVLQNYILNYLDVVPEIVQEQLDI